MATTKKYKNEEEKKEGEKIPPTLTSVKAFFLIKAADKILEIPSNESDKFFNFYESKGWVVGKNKMKNWKSAVANWVAHAEYPSAENSLPKSERQVLLEEHDRLKHLIESPTTNGREREKYEERIKDVIIKGKKLSNGK